MRSTTVAPEGFDARFSAVWRRYSYRLADATTGYDPLDRLRTTAVRSTLDLAAMDAAAQRLIGLHDFAAYCKAREEATTIRTLLEYDWRRADDGVLVLVWLAGFVPAEVEPLGVDAGGSAVGAVLDRKGPAAVICVIA